MVVSCAGHCTVDSGLSISLQGRIHIVLLFLKSNLYERRGRCPVILVDFEKKTVDSNEHNGHGWVLSGSLCPHSTSLLPLVTRIRMLASVECE